MSNDIGRRTGKLMENEQAFVPCSFDVSPATRRHREMLGLSLVAIVLSFVLDVRSDQRVFIRGYPRLVLPESCPSRAWFGVRCPGCGLTRSFIHLARGDWRRSIADNRVGILTAFATLAQIPYRGAALALKRDRPLGAIFPKIFGYLLIVSLIGAWAITIVW